MSILEIVAAAFIVVGFVFLVIGAAGVIKLPDFFTRLHGAGVGDTLGAFLVIVGMMIYVGLHILSLKIFLVFLILLLSNPFGTNLIMIEGVRFLNYKEYLQQRSPAERESGEKGEEEDAS